MKILLLLPAVVLSFCCFEASAQVTVNKDSLSLVKKLTQDKERLLKLQSEVKERTNEKEETAIKAQQSADENRRAADRLTNDPQDKKLARRADNAASDARSDAKKARRAADRLDDLKKDIRDLSERVEKNEARLGQYVLVRNGARTEPVVDKDTVLPNH